MSTYVSAHSVEMELAPDSMIRDYKLSLETLLNLPVSRLTKKK